MGQRSAAKHFTATSEFCGAFDWVWLGIKITQKEPETLLRLGFWRISWNLIPSSLFKEVINDWLMKTGAHHDPFCPGTRLPSGAFRYPWLLVGRVTELLALSLSVALVASAQLITRRLLLLIRLRSPSRTILSCSQFGDKDNIVVKLNCTERNTIWLDRSTLPFLISQTPRALWLQLFDWIIFPLGDPRFSCWNDKIH